MAADRRERAKSIRAARDWLTGAEDALAGEDDPAGDLKLMLARAELARIAADRRARLRRLALRLLPPFVGAAVLVWALWNVPSEESASAPPVQNAERVAPVPTPERPEQVSAPAAVSAAVPPPAEMRAEMAAETEAASQERVRQEPQSAAAAASAQRAEERVAPALPARVPDADMQRLMQVGGKILRE